jgi:TonB family protein
VQYLYPPPREVGTPRPGQANTGAFMDNRTAGGLMPSWKDRANGASAGEGVAQSGAVFAPNPDLAAERDEPGVGDNAFSAIEVDSIAVVDPNSAGPEYPKTLAERSVEGMVSMRFVVDSTGRVDMSTVRVVNTTHRLFAQAVITAMPKMKYRPASIAGRPVRLLVQQSFSFQIQKPKGKIA